MGERFRCYYIKKRLYVYNNVNSRDFGVKRFIIPKTKACMFMITRCDFVFIYLEYYPNCEIQFMSLPNIHAIRKSFHGVRTLCLLGQEQSKYVE